MTPKRRQYRSGSIAQRADGLWVGRLEAGWTSRGTRRRLIVTAATEAECKRRLERKKAEVARDGPPAEGLAGRMSVKTWAGKWLEIRRHELRPKTFTAYRSSINAGIVPAIGHKRLDMLTPGDVREVAVYLRRRGRSTTTALHAHRVLIHLLKDAIVEGHAVPQRVLLTAGPATAVNDRTSFPPEQALLILEQAARLPHGSRWAAALLQGLRQGEALGLTWSCVDLDAGTIDVSWQLQSLAYEDRKTRTFRVPDGYQTRRLHKTLHLVRPKTAQGQRILPIVPWMVHILRQWRAVAPASPHDLVWPRPDGTPMLTSEDSAEWRALQDAAGVRHPSGRHYTGHEARHTTATLLLDAGVDPKTVMSVLGHSSIVTSRAYQHVSQALARQAMEKIAARLELT